MTIARQENLTKPEAIDLLCSIYELENISYLTQIISVKAKLGLSITQIRQLKVLVSYLKTLIDRIENF